VNPILRPIDREEWTELARGFLDYNYRQNWAYGQHAAARVGATSENVGIFRGEEAIALANVRVKRVPVIGGGVAFISGGPLVNRGDEQGVRERLSQALLVLRDEYVTRRGMMLRILGTLGDEQSCASQRAAYERLGFGPFHGPGAYRTMVLDLSADEGQIRKNLAQKWRNCLNNAERQGIHIKVATDEAAVATFEGIFGAFVDRKKFTVGLSPDFFRQVQAELAEHERLVVQLAELNGEVVAGHMSSMLGNTCVYLLGATLEAGLKTKAAYLLQWNTILQARQRGMRWYDLGGIDANANPGVYHFKAGIGGCEWCAPGPFQFNPIGPRAVLAASGERLYRRLQSLRAKRAAK
jgi:hypothetical protein